MYKVVLFPNTNFWVNDNGRAFFISCHSCCGFLPSKVVGVASVRSFVPVAEANVMVCSLHVASEVPFSWLKCLVMSKSVQRTYAPFHECMYRYWVSLKSRRLYFTSVCTKYVSLSSSALFQLLARWITEIKLHEPGGTSTAKSKVKFSLLLACQVLLFSVMCKVLLIGRRIVHWGNACTVQNTLATYQKQW